MPQGTSTRGAKLITVEELATIQVPSSSGRWYPIGHAEALGLTEEALGLKGYEVSARELYVLRSDARFVGIIDLAVEVAKDVTLVVGILSSFDQSLPLGFIAGHRSKVTGCFSVRSDLMIKRKHTTTGESRFSSDIARAIEELPAFVESERARIALMKQTKVDARVAESILLRAYEQSVIRSRDIDAVIRGWRKPTLEEFVPATFWSLSNVITAVIGKSGKLDPYRRYVRSTMRLNALLDGEPELQSTPARP